MLQESCLLGSASEYYFVLNWGLFMNGRVRKKLKIMTVDFPVFFERARAVASGVISKKAASRLALSSALDSLLVAADCHPSYNSI